MTIIDILQEKLVGKNVIITSYWRDSVRSGMISDVHIGSTGTEPGIILFRLNNDYSASYPLFAEDNILIHE